MSARLFVVTFLLTSNLSVTAVSQPTEAPTSDSPVIESPPPTIIVDGQHQPALSGSEGGDATIRLGELRGAVRTFPGNADSRLKLAEGLYRVGDFDAAIEECRAAIKLNPDHPQAHVQLGISLMAKQDWRAAASVLKEALRLDSGSVQAHYSLAGVQYSLGNVKGAILSYRQAIELQPYFPDARYHLALLLKLTHQDQEAAQIMEEAALGGVPNAQFFLGNAYKNGQGVEKNLGAAIYWWTKASEFGQQPAADALSKLRRQALSSDRSDRRREEALDGFHTYRERLWNEFPDYSRPDDHGTLGTLLVKEHRPDQALVVLLKEGYALSEPAHLELAALYETGWEPQLAPFDKKILACFETTAAEGFLPAKKILARIYAKGLGVTVDPRKAKAALTGLSKQEAKVLLNELGLK